ncbi:MAG: arylsulfotransferase family protein [Solirubrobacterales bacterium]
MTARNGLAIAACAAGVGTVLAMVAMASDGAGPAQSARAAKASFSAPSLYPRFEAGRHYYVARCKHATTKVTMRAAGPYRISAGGSKPRSGRSHARLGVEPGQNFRVRVTRGRKTRSYEVRCLPRRFPKWRFQRLEVKAPKPGLIALGSRASEGIPPWVAIFDSSGTPRWWYQAGTRPINVQVLRGGTVAWSRAYGDGYGRDPRQAQEIHALSGKLIRVLRPRGRISDPHELTQEPDRDYLVESYVPHGPVDLRAYGGPKRAAIVYPEVQELSRKGRLLRRWSLLHKITLDDTSPTWWSTILRNPRRRRGGLPTYDVVHVNAIEPWGRQLVVSTRHTDAVFGFSRKTGKIRWKLGGTPSPKSLTMSGGPYSANELFGGEHDARVYGKGALSIFDNGTRRSRPARGVVYRLDLKDRTAKYLGELVDPRARKGNCCGSLRAIPGGWLIGFGDTTLVSAFNSRRQVAWRLWWGNSYRAVPVPRGRVTMRQLDRGLEQMEP